MQFERESLKVNGIAIQLLTAGRGDPLLFLHGAGTWHGFDFALPWAEHHRVMIPLHPGWENSGDAPQYSTVHDYVMHYVEFLDQLGLDQVDLVGQSMGGRMAASFASEHRRRVKKLVMVSPPGLEVPGHGLTDFSKIDPEQILDYLTQDVAGVLLPRLPAEMGPEWEAARAREGGSFFKLVGTDLLDGKFAHWLHRITMPSLMVWGEKDRAVPVQQLDRWIEAIPNLQVLRVPGGGHLVMDEQPSVVATISKFLQRSV